MTNAPEKIYIESVISSKRGIASVELDEHDDERTSRLKAEARSKLLEDIKDMTVFFVVLVGLVSICVSSAYLSFIDQNASLDTKKLAQTVLTAVVSGSLTFLVGRKISSK